MSTSRRKWALVTGASPGGMGEAEAAAFLKRGVNVISTSLDAEDIQYLRPDEGSTNGFLVTCRLDVTSSDSIAETVRYVSQLTDGKLDFLMNNAGYGYYIPLLDVDIEQMRKQYDVNVFGLLAVMQAFFPLLRAAKGTLVNQASLCGIEGYNLPYVGAYSSSKAAVLSLSNTMRVELAPFEIKVVTLITSAVKTEFYNHRLGGVVKESSSYFPAKQDVEEAMGSSEFDKRGLSRQQVAEETIEEILRDQPPVFIRKGYMASAFAWIYWLLPVWATDWMAVKVYKLDRLKRILGPGDDQEKKD